MNPKTVKELELLKQEKSNLRVAVKEYNLRVAKINANTDIPTVTRPDIIILSEHKM